MGAWQWKRSFLVAHLIDESLLICQVLHLFNQSRFQNEEQPLQIYLQEVTYIHTYFIDFPKGLFQDNT